MELLQHLSQTEYLYLGAAALVLLFFLVLLLRRQPKSVAAYSTENGQVMVSRSAIIELVQTSCEQISEVSKPQVRIKTKRGATNFEIRLKLTSGAQLRTVEQTLQSHLREALSKNLAIENLGRIDINAVGFKSGRIERASAIGRKTDQAAEAPEATESSHEPYAGSENSDDYESGDGKKTES